MVLLRDLSKMADYMKNNAEHLETVVAQINNNLNTSGKRLQGLLLLKDVLCQCSEQVFCSNFHTWLNLMLQTLQVHGQPEHKQGALHVLCLMIERVTAFPELAREMGTTKVKVILPAVLSLTSKKVKEAVASCISACILRFPGPTSFFKDKIETFLVEELDTDRPSHVYIHCYTLLARCTAGGHRGEKQRELWTTQYEKLMSALNCMLSQLYTGLESDGEGEGENSIFLCPVPNVQPQQTVCLTRRFSTLCACLGNLLREPFPTWTPVYADEILRLVGRATAVQVDLLMKRGSSDHLLLMSNLPQIYTSIFTVLTDLIISVKRLLIPSGQMIVRLCSQCLASVGNAAPFRKVRECAYHAISMWVQFGGLSCGCKDKDLTDLLTEVFSDICLHQPEALQIEKDSAMSLPMKKKKKKRNKHNNYQELSVRSHVLTLRDSEDTVVAALQVLKHLMSHTAVTMSDDVFNNVKTKLCELLKEVQQTAHPPYTSPSCRDALYQVLMAAVGVPRPSPYFTQEAIGIFQRGIIDSDFKVMATCQEAMRLCHCLVHPQAPCFQEPVVKPAHVPSSSSSTSTVTSTTFGRSDDTITSSTTTTTNSKTSVIRDAVRSSVNLFSSADSRRMSPAHPLPSSSLADGRQSHTASVSDSSEDSATPSTSESMSNVSSVKRKRGVTDSDVRTKRMREDSDSGDVKTRAAQGGDIEKKRGAKESSDKKKRLSIDNSSEDSDDNDNDDDDAGDNEGQEEEMDGDAVEEADDRPSKSKGVKSMEVTQSKEEASEEVNKPAGSTVKEDAISVETETNTDMSAMMSSFVPCEADSGDNVSDSD